MSEEAGMPGEEQGGFTLRDVMAVFRRRWLPVLLATLLGLGLAALLTALQPRLYTSSSTAVVNPVVTDNPAAALSQDTVAKSRAVQYNELAKSMLVATRAVDLVDFPLTPGQARGAVTTTVPTGTSLIQVRAEWADAQQAAQLADAWVEALTQEADTLARADGATPQVQINRMLPATVPGSHSSPREALNLLVGGALGLAAGVGLALLLEALDRRIRGTEDLQRAGLTPIGMIPASIELSGDRRVLLEGGSNPDASHFRVREAFNELRINLQFMNPDDPPRIITVTSTNPADGKSTVAANLAATLAHAGVPSVLVDADLRRPTVATTFGLLAGAGLSDVVVGRADLADVIQAPAEFGGLLVLPAGQVPPNPTELLMSDRFKQALEALAETHMVIVDAPPLLAVSDAAVMATRLDGALLVLDAKSTTRDDVRQAVTALERVHAPILGAVLNRVESKGKDGRYGYYRSDYTTAAPSA
ncbi:polysaccharide biosynthesis tyrosine autokinase [Micrococcus sp. 2A]|uniref:polysaccharide biosynthesis tyrosine autokinase n=1 Tax=Micrococcus sp. 2A TaxID=3142261 RepID=UPI0031BBB2DE